MSTVDFSKIGRKSRRKGKSFERRIKELISKYLKIPIEYLEQPFEWRGQPLGDIIALGRYYDRLPIFIEAKKRENWDLKCVFSRASDNVLLRWWFKTAEKMPDEVDMQNLALVFSKNYYPIFIMLPYGTFENLLLKIVLSDTDNIDFVQGYINCMITFYSEKLDEKFVITRFDDFLKERAKVLSLL